MTPFVYRGSLERSRLAFLLSAAARAFGPVKFWWLAPRALDRAAVEHAQGFLRRRLAVEDWELLDGRYTAFVSARSRLRAVLRSDGPLVVVGADALDFVRGTRSRRLVWCVNGIHEERLMTPARWGRAGVAAEWWLHRLGRRPDLTVTVSGEMSRHYARRAGSGSYCSAPCTVDDEIFKVATPPQERPPVVAYLGSGAPWQGLPQLAAIWRELARVRPDLRFLVISRDERCRALVEGLGDRAVMQGVDRPEDVCALLQQARVGCLVREDHLVNRVAFPTKFAEYLASGCMIFSTDIQWDISQYLEKYRCGATVAPAESPGSAARQLAELVDRAPQAAAACEAAAAALSNTRWSERVAIRMRGDSDAMGFRDADH